MTSGTAVREEYFCCKYDFIFSARENATACASLFIFSYILYTTFQRTSLVHSYSE